MSMTRFTAAVLIVALAGALAGCAGWLPPPGYGGPGPAGPGNAPPPASRAHFTARQRAFAHRYFGRGHGPGNCPPGLAKKHDGCMPPGQARKWKIGQALPGDVNTYPVSQYVYRGLGAPPPGYRYVRVLDDILLVSTETNRVVDAIKDMGRQ